MIKCEFNSIMSTDLQQKIGDFTLFLKHQRQLSQNTVSSYGYDLQSLFKFLYKNAFNEEPLSLKNISFIEAPLWRQWLSSRISSGMSYKSNARAISAVKTFTKWANINASAFNLKQPKLPNLLPKVISSKDVNTIIKASSMQKQKSWQNMRDEALLTLLFTSGLRISEAIAITQAQVKSNQAHLCIIGKGNKERAVPLLPIATKAINNYLAISPFKTDQIFISNTGKPYTRRMAEHTFTKLRRTCMLSEFITPHTMRKSFATELFESTTDPTVVKKVKDLLGHANLATTQKYVKISKSKSERALLASGYWQAS